jgi:regulator of protease activity HflC (stomatin/prohibitin superfamily)
MKKSILFICVLICFAVSGCGYSKIPAGYEGVKINTLGDDKGSIKTVGVGRHFYSIKYEMKKFPLFKQNYVWTKTKDEGSQNDESITFQSKESLTFNADIGVSYSVQKGRSADIYKTYHKGIGEITDIDMRNAVRDAFNRIGSGKSVEEIYGAGKAAFVESVHNDVKSVWDKQGITVHKIYLVGEMRPPAQVKKSISAKVAATQKAQQRRNEVKQATAEADKVIEQSRGTAESKKIAADASAYEIIKNAEAEAKAVKLVQRQLSKSPEYIEYLKATRWNGVLPQIVGSQTMPMVKIN